MRRILPIVSLLLLLGIVALLILVRERPRLRVLPPPPDIVVPDATLPTDEILWGQPQGGLQAGIQFESVNWQPEPSIDITLHLRNAGDKPVRIMQLYVLAEGCGRKLPLEVQGSWRILRYRGPPPGPSPEVYDDDEFRVLAPGQEDNVYVTMNAWDWRLGDPRVGKLTFVYRLVEPPAFAEGPKVRIYGVRTATGPTSTATRPLPQTAPAPSANELATTQPCTTSSAPAPAKIWTGEVRSGKLDLSRLGLTPPPDWQPREDPDDAGDWND